MSNHHAEELEGYKNLYSQILIQTFRDLQLPIQMNLVRPSHQTEQVPSEWYKVIGANLNALRRDKHLIDSRLQILPLSETIDLWLSNRLLSFAVEEPASSPYQAEVNSAIVERLDSTYNFGDCYLTALSVVRFPNLLIHFAICSGIRKEKAEEIIDLFVETAKPIAAEAWQKFAEPMETANVSVFRPTKPNVAAGERRLFRKKNNEV